MRKMTYKKILESSQNFSVILMKMRNLIRITLKRHKYPPDHQVGALELVMQQAEALSNEWSNPNYSNAVYQ